MRAVRPRIVQGTMIPLAPEALADVREPERAVAIENDVVRTAAPLSNERLIEMVEAADSEIHTLDASRSVFNRCAQPQERSVRFAPLQSAVAVDIDCSVHFYRCADQHFT